MTTNFDIVINLGEGKEIKLRKWKGKERRALQQVISEESDAKLEDVLVYNCMQSKIYLSQKEILYTIFVLYSHSFVNTIEKTFECSSCGVEHIVEVSVDDILESVELPLFSNIVIGDDTYNFKNTATLSDAFLQRQNDTILNSDKLFNELCGHLYEIISSGEEKVFASWDELSEYIDNLPIEDFDKLMEAYLNQTFQFTPSLEYTCSECKEHNIEYVDIINQMLRDFFA
jgi:hypothetical protein